MMKTQSMLKRIPLWGKVLPLIAVAAGVAVVATGAGITGDNPVKVGEPVTFVSTSTKVTGGAEAVIYNDETSMIVSAETFPNDSYTLELALKNESGADQSQKIMIEAPEGFRFADATTTSATTIIGVDQDGPRVFFYQIDDTATAAVLKLTVSVLPQVVPGWYSWSFSTEALPTTTNFD